MALPPLTAGRTLRADREATGRSTPHRRGLVPAAPYDLLACTKPLEAGLRHCYLRVEDRAGRAGSFTLSFDPAGTSQEHEPNKPGTRCTYIATLNANEVGTLQGAWHQSVNANPRYHLLNNNCCTKTIGALNRIGVSAPADILSANFGYH